MAACDALVRQDIDWVPQEGENSLYLRPFMFATEVGLGVKPANEYLFMVIASPAGSYFPGGVKPVSVWLSQEYVRAAPGGTGAAKCAGNYAASLIAQAQANGRGLRPGGLAGRDRAPLGRGDGRHEPLLRVHRSRRHPADRHPGTVRLAAARHHPSTRCCGSPADLGYEAGEGRISVEDWKAATEDGSLTEVFACGTAAAITPVGSVKSTRENWTVGDGQPGEVTMRLREALLDIQTGRAADTHGWLHRLG